MSTNTLFKPILLMLMFSLLYGCGGDIVEEDPNDQTPNDQNKKPSVSFASPVASDNFTAGDNLVVQINASDSDGTISRVELYMNGSLLDVKDNAPYIWSDNIASLNGLQVGGYTLEAVATDDSGLQSTTAVNINVKSGNDNQNNEPSVSFVLPTLSDSFKSGDNLSVLVNASDSDGTISRVELYMNGSFLGSDNNAPYMWDDSINALKRLQVGGYTLEAVATDNLGLQSKAVININVKSGSDNQNNEPSVSFVLPKLSDNFKSGDNLSVLVNASDSDGTISRVELYMNGSFLGADNNAPYMWDDSIDALKRLQVGGYTLEAVATDNLGLQSKTVMNINVRSGSDNQNTEPSVSFVSPKASDNITAGDNLVVQVNASDSDGTISRVELYMNGSLLGVENNAPYIWNGSIASLNDLQEGDYTLEAVATDNLGLKSTTILNINVKPGNDNQNKEPSVSFASPKASDNITAGDSLVVQVNASDSDGTISRVELYMNGSLLGVDNNAPYMWNDSIASLMGLQAGNYTLDAVATDNLGLQSTTTLKISVKSGNDNPIALNPFDDQCSPLYLQNKIKPTLRLIASTQLRHVVEYLSGNTQVSYTDPFSSHQAGGELPDAESLLMDTNTTAQMFELMDPLSKTLADSLNNDSNCSAEANINDEMTCFIPRIMESLSGLTNLDNTEFEIKLSNSYTSYRANAQADVALHGTILEHLMSMDFLFRSELGRAQNGTYTLNAHELGTAIHWVLAQRQPSAEWLAFFSGADWENPELLSEKINTLLNQSNNGVEDFLDIYFYLGSEPVQGLPLLPTGSIKELDQALSAEMKSVIGDANFTFKDLFVGNLELLKSPSLLARLTPKANKPSPVSRGHFVGGKLLCEEPPGIAVDFPIIDVSQLPASLTPREVLEKHHESQSCKGCHKYMDPFGFPLDVFDIVGQPINEWANGKPIDTQVTVDLPNLSINGEYFNLDSLTQAIVDAPEFNQCLNLAMGSYLSGFDLTEQASAQAGCGSNTTQADQPLSYTIANFFLSKSFRERRVED